MSYKKHPYQRRNKRNIDKESILIEVRDSCLEIPRDNLLLKAIEVESHLWEIAKNGEEALLIAELLVVSSKEPFL